MLRLTIALLAVALAGSASAGGWRSLVVDGSSEAAFAESLAVFKEKLSPARRHVFGEALKDIWVQGTKNAEAEQREYTASEYYRQVDGLGYEEVVTVTDPTGDTAKTRYRVYLSRYAPPAPAASSPWPVPNDAGGPKGRSDAGDATARAACGCAFPHAWY